MMTDATMKGWSNLLAESIEAFRNTAPWSGFKAIVALY